MADETTPTPEAAAPVEQTDDEFDWGKFFADENPDLAAKVETPPPGVEAVFVDEDAADLRRQLAKAQEDSARALELATASQTQSRMQGAIDAWKAQATPAEQQLSDILLKSKTPEELQENARIVKEAASKLGAAYDERLQKDRRDMEVQMQRDFGIPIPPTFTPMPEEEKVNQMLKDGDLDGAAAAMLKGVFNQ